MGKLIKYLFIVIGILFFIILIYFVSSRLLKTHYIEKSVAKNIQTTVIVNKDLTKANTQKDVIRNVDSQEGKISEDINTTIKKTELDTGKKWGLWLGIVFILLAFNILTLIALLGVLRWRRTVSEGMMAIIPNQVINEMKNLSDTQSKQAEWIGAHMQQILKFLSQQTESVNILKKELTLKENEIAMFKSGGELKEKEKIISKIIKLHSFLNRLEHQVATGGVKHDVALGFLRDELADLFEEFGITEINPIIGSSIKDLPNEGFTAKNINKVEEANLNLTVSELIEPGYLFTSDTGKQKILRPALISINKFGG